MNILQACADPNVFGDHFEDEGSWSSWFAFLAATFGLELTAQQRKIYRACTRCEETTGGSGQ